MIKIKKTKSIYIFFAVFFIAIVNIYFNGINVSAATDWSSPVMKKALLTGLVQECYLSGRIASEVDFLEADDTDEILVNANGENQVALPNGLTKINDNGVSCNQLLNGYNINGSNNTFEGLLKLSGKFNELDMVYNNEGGTPLIGIYNPTKLVTFLNGMGYNNSDQRSWCYYYEYYHDGEPGTYSQNVCWDDGSQSLVVEEIGNDTNVQSYHYSADGVSQINYPKLSVDDNNKRVLVITDDSNNKSMITYELTDSKVNFENKLATKLKERDLTYPPSFRIEGRGIENTGLNSGNNYKLQPNAATTALRFLSSGAYSTFDGLKFSKQERLSYYIAALKNWFFKDKSTGDYFANDLDSTEFSYYTSIHVDITSGARCNSCGIDTGASTKTNSNKFSDNSNTIFGFNSNDYFSTSGNEYVFDLEGTIEEINKLVDSMSDEEIASTPETDSATSEVNDPCLDSQVADNLGWIICPIMNIARDATEGLYNDFVEPALSVEPQLFSENNNINEGPTHDAWTVFQGFANIGFTILFLVVIFSQLTGVGIDNYGIKKILPKLIIAAVLVNLSYIICVICVDLSNILGSSLQDMFVAIPVQSGKTPYPGVGESFGSTVLTAVPIAVGVIAAWYLITPAILLGLLISVIGLIISLLFLFLLLAGREAAIVVLTVISPLAFLCYMLPNTKKLFDKWLKIWEGLLLVYPIAGLLMGGGNFVSRLLVAISGGDGSGGSFFTAFAAMMISIVPIFFIPTVLKGAFSALGNIGGKLAGMGNALSGKATGAVRKSEAYKNARKRSAEWNTERRAGIGMDVKNMNALQRAMRGVAIRDSSIARNRSGYLDNQKAKSQLDRYLDNDYMEGVTAAMEDKQRDEAIDQQLALMKRNGVNGQAYSLDAMKARMETLSKQTSFSSSDMSELAALSRGLADEKGGGGVLSKTIRSANATGINGAFMAAMGEVYARDSKVRSKLNEKDVAASVFTEQFMPHSDKSKQPQGNFQQFRTDKENHDKIGARIKTYEQGLSQSGEAMNEYVNEYLTDADVQRISEDKAKMSGLETDAIKAIDERAAKIRAQGGQQSGGNTGQDNGGTQRAAERRVNQASIRNNNAASGEIQVRRRGSSRKFGGRR